MAQQEVIRHNMMQLSRMEEGDLIQFDRGLILHWAVYIGDGTVVHVTPSDDSGTCGGFCSSNCCNGKEEKVVVKEDNFWKVAKKDKAFLNNKKDNKMKPLSRTQIVQNALSKLGNYGYNLLFNNCEHFASWCRYGKSKSEQADNALTGIAVTVATIFTGALIGTVLAFGRPDSSKKKEKSERYS